MLNRIARFIEDNRLLDRGKRHLVAVSGGADSVFLLLALHHLGYKVEAVHCNFNLREEESTRDERFVVELCKKLSIELHLIHFDTKTYAHNHQVSIEMAARELRYRYFEQLRHDIGAEDVCVAHHKDDSAETILMNLLRGTGLRGLEGIKPRHGHIVRPLLCVERREIEAWLEANGQIYMTDRTNLVPDIMRNFLRIEIIPRLRTKSPHVTDSILNTSRHIAEAVRVYDDAVKKALGQLLCDNCVDIAQLVQTPSPESLLYEWLSPYGFTPPAIEGICRRLADIQPGRSWTSPTHELHVHQGQLCLVPIEADRPTIMMPETGLYVYDETTHIRVSRSNKAEIISNEQTACLDAAKVEFPLTVRPMQPGDRFCPLGLNGTKLLSDFLTDLHLSIRNKRRQLVVADATGQIVWVVGRRIDHRFRITDQTTDTLLIAAEYASTD